MKKLLLLIVVLFFSCQSVPEQVDPNLSQAELFQLAQQEVDAENWPAALKYYETAKERFPEDESSKVIADYEIGFILFKQDRLQEAKTQLNIVLEQYETASVAIPEWPKILSTQIIERINAKTSTIGAE